MPNLCLACSPKLQYVDGNGKPLSGGQLFTYQFGSTILQNTYKTNGSSAILNTNPIILDSNGECTMFLDESLLYKFVLYDANSNLIWSLDNVYPNASMQQLNVQVAALNAEILAGGNYTGAINENAQVTVPSNSTTNIGACGSNNVLISGTSTINGFDTNYVAGATRNVEYQSNCTITYNSVSMQLVGQATRQNNSGDTSIFLSLGGGNWKELVYQPNSPSTTPTPLFLGALTGLILSTPGSSTTLSVSAGRCGDSTGVGLMILSAISKNTGSWSAGTGNGGLLDSGGIVPSTWYYAYVIENTSSGVVDVGFSATAPAAFTVGKLPTGYSLFRYIGAALINGSSQWTKFIQRGQDFIWDTPILDFNGTSSLTAVLTTLTVPRLQVEALLNVSCGGCSTYISDPDSADIAPSISANPLASTGNNNSFYSQGQVFAWTNTSAQIRHRETGSGGSALYMSTIGWFDPNIKP